MSRQFTRDYLVEVALGNIPGSEFRTVFGQNTVNEGEANEIVLGTGQTTRYPFPTVAIQVDIVSTSADDTLLGIGGRVLLIRGLDSSKEELFESIALDGISTVTSIGSFLRVNSTTIVSAGSNGKNAGIITTKNGADLLSQIAIGFNLSQDALWSIPVGVTALVLKFDSFTLKDDSVIVVPHLFTSALGNIDLKVLSLPTYQNQVGFGSFAKLATGGGSDIEITAFSEAGTGASTVSALFELLLVDD